MHYTQSTPPYIIRSLPLQTLYPVYPSRHYTQCIPPDITRSLSLQILHAVSNACFSDGQKMSKSKKNFPEPTLVVDKYGADAVRSVTHCRGQLHSVEVSYT